MCLLSVLMCANFVGNLKMSDFLKAYISGMAGTIYFGSGMCSLQICQHLYSKYGLVWARDHRATGYECVIALCSSC